MIPNFYQQISNTAFPFPNYVAVVLGSMGKFETFSLLYSFRMQLLDPGIDRAAN